jgi:hypothetical protein
MKSFLQGRKSLAVAPLRPLAGTPASASAKTAAARASLAGAACGGAQPVIDVVREGDKIVRIVVTCTCGERTEIECLYAGGA